MLFIMPAHNITWSTFTFLHSDDGDDDGDYKIE